MSVIRTVQTVFKISSFLLRSTLGGAAVAVAVAALMMKKQSASRKK
ncbi:MAG TPA: hypothetical protein VLH56_10130 [Dissulfurispiraceae bacterium]|nr:hypothetical protein [Dissulfurispiraceae bacterium]